VFPFVHRKIEVELKKESGKTRRVFRVEEREGRIEYSRSGDA
jgi:hypothetical protein